ncbi:hypothetical protein ACU4GR_28600 [Methylobacterium oryzae CBMB20]
MRVAVTGSAGPAIGTRVVDALAGLRPLAPFFCLYVTFGATLGFLSGGAPLILRARGVELAEVGLLQLINLPVGLTFLWAPLLDRLRLPVLGHRIGWIAAAQAASVLLLVVLSFGETWPLPALLALAIAACAGVATMDIALEALVVETVPAERRAFVASAKLCGASSAGSWGSACWSAPTTAWAGAGRSWPARPSTPSASCRSWATGRRARAGQGGAGMGEARSAGRARWGGCAAWPGACSCSGPTSPPPTSWPGPTPWRSSISAPRSGRSGRSPAPCSRP